MKTARIITALCFIGNLALMILALYIGRVTTICITSFGTGCSLTCLIFNFLTVPPLPPNVTLRMIIHSKSNRKQERAAKPYGKG